MSATRSIVVVFVSLFAAATAHAGAPPSPGPWALSVVGGINLAESAFSDNWAGGDKGNINWVLNADLGAKRQLSSKVNWSNQLQLAFGQTSTQRSDAASPSRKSWSTPDKTTDLILFESVGRFTLGAFVDPYLSFRLDSQFLDESDPIGRIALNPIKLTETAGAARVLHCGDADSAGCKEEWIVRTGFGFRQSIARSFADSTGRKNNFTTNDGGVELQSTAKFPLADKRVLYDAKLLVFLPVFYSRSDALTEFDRIARAADPAREAVADFWKVPDVNFQNTFTSQITSWLNVNLYAQWVYDKFDAATNVVVEGAAGDPAVLEKLTHVVDAGTRKAGQFKQTLGIGLTYKFL
ncbi:MAG: DUF3078 domain-containing protein [bacterium]